MKPTRTALETEIRRLTTPRAAAFAGILFSLLLGTSLILLRIAIPKDLTAEIDWLEKGAGQIDIATKLIPFAGIAFLWFVGVVRDRLGRFEDQFFSTVFFGSSLLFLGMLFVSSAIAGSLVAVYRNPATEMANREVIYFGRVVMVQLSNIYALRMAGVFMISLGTIWWRTGLMPRSLVMITYLLALALLLVINLSLWISLIFPVWVLIISILILVQNLKRSAS